MHLHPEMFQHSVYQSRVTHRVRFRLIKTCLFAAVLATAALLAGGQDLPKSIRGYKVHNQVIKVTNKEPAAPGGPYIAVDRPTVSDISLGGVTLAIAGELGNPGHEGRVEMMTFRSFRVNGVSVEVSEYNTPFELRKSGKIKLPAPANVFLLMPNILNAAWNELADSKKEWSVTGRVFVFGKFKKFGFHFKRVIPVDVEIVIENPLIEHRKKVLSAIPAS